MDLRTRPTATAPTPDFLTLAGYGNRAGSKTSQSRVFTCDQRFRVLVAGRRFGKTYLALTELCRAGWGAGRAAWYVAPTYRQAKRIAWKPLKAMTRRWWAEPPNETGLRIELVNGGTIALRGADHYDSLRGEGLDFVVLDEYASMAPEAWTEVLRPSLSDRLGAALFIGTPKGHNHFYELFQAAQDAHGWRAFQFTTEQGGLVQEIELAAARGDLDELHPRGEEVDISPSATVALMRDGNQIVAMLGPDIQAGISGFGDTTIEALKDLAAQMECEKYRLEGIDF